jgi:glutathione S-transferase
MATLSLYTKSGGCSIVLHALMRHLSIDFLITRDEDPPTDVMDTNLPFEEYNLEFARRLRDIICQFPPQLAVNTYSLTEMPAILTYLTLRGRQEGELMGRNESEKVVVMQWLSYLEGKLYSRAFKMMGNPESFSAEASSHRGIQVKGKAFLELCFGKINESLAGKEYTVCKRCTVVDFNLYMFARWYKELWPSRDFDTRYPEFFRVMKSVEALEGVRAAVREQQKRLLF